MKKAMKTALAPVECFEADRHEMCAAALWLAMCLL